MKHAVLTWRMGALVSALTAAAPLRAQADDALPKELEGVSIEDRRGAQAPLDVTFLDQDGKSATLGDYLKDGKPLILALAYYRCPMLCSLVLNGMTDGMRALTWSAGKEYRVLVVSIDPKESVSLARRKRENYLKEYGRLVQGNGYDFAVVSPERPEDVKRLADAVGFNYRYDAATEQYVHAAGLFVLSPTGTVSQTLYGIEFESGALRLALADASAGRLGSAWDRVLLFCFHYDPDSRGYVLHATRLMRLAGGATAAIMGLALLGLWRRDLKRAAARRAREGK